MVLEIREQRLTQGEEVTGWEGALRSHQGDGNHMQGAWSRAMQSPSCRPKIGTSETVLDACYTSIFKI